MIKLCTKPVRTLLAALLSTLLMGSGASAGPVDQARLYLRGSAEVPVNLPKAYALFSTAAKAGDAQAAYYLGMMYRNGMGVAANAKTAAHWLSFAANHQMPAAMFALAHLYLSGEGVKRDELVARRWIEKAADLEYPDAVMAMAIGLRDGSMGFERNEALYETQMRFAQRAFERRTSGM
ncbi:tetratricopeptide repeat protein [Pseudoduganella danionis]|uniref:Sel1 repeat family protein n=1 Tax=Pseudoduganella danionis TaxID=1890295 RepID=A0ABW9SKR6_9BURK|nr:tetratricopeptide repeat protein [Pseudoduganella danionis]MTW32763.1 sel1 repeat family protein [Pseudoduganella danionis]